MERRRERLFSRIKSPETNPAEAECTYHRSSPAPMQSSACEARQEFINHQIRREWFPPRNHGGGACGLRQKCGAGPLPPHRRRPVCSGRNNALAGGCQNADASVGFYGDAELDLKREHPRRNDSCLEARARASAATGATIVTPWGRVSPFFWLHALCAQRRLPGAPVPPFERGMWWSMVPVAGLQGLLQMEQTQPLRCPSARRLFTASDR